MEKNEDLGTRLENAGKRFFRKTKEFADATKLSIKLKEYELDLDNLYQIAGKAAYYGEDTKEIFTQITNKLEQIEEVKVDIADAKGLKICGNCKAEMPKEAVACMKCGEKFE
ncbi:MAG TPA: hypothetical protein PKJ65_03560 [Clostridia bacterium]|nr:hypothetical protein [Clostridia bacterium]